MIKAKSGQSVLVLVKSEKQFGDQGNRSLSGLQSVIWARSQETKTWQSGEKCKLQRLVAWAFPVKKLSRIGFNLQKSFEDHTEGSYITHTPLPPMVTSHSLIFI